MNCGQEDIPLQAKLHWMCSRPSNVVWSPLLLRDGLAYRGKSMKFFCACSIGIRHAARVQTKPLRYSVDFQGEHELGSDVASAVMCHGESARESGLHLGEDHRSQVDLGSSVCITGAIIAGRVCDKTASK